MMPSPELLTEAKACLKARWGDVGDWHLCNIFRLGVAMQDLGLWMLNDVIWQSKPHAEF